MLLLGMGLLATLQRTSAEVYHDLQARLARYASVRVSTTPMTGDGWDHESEHGFLRPNKGFRQEPNFYFATDGRASWILQLGDKPRPAGRDDLAKYAGLKGFESFFEPRVEVTGALPPRSVEWERSRLTALDLTIGRESGVLYLDPATGLPRGWGWRWKSPREGARESMPRIYSKIELGAPIHSAELRRPAVQGDFGKP